MKWQQENTRANKQKQPWLTLLTTVRQKLLVSYSKVVISSIFEFKMQKLNSVLVSSLPNQPEYPLFVFFARDGWNRSVVAIANSWVRSRL